MDVFLDPNVAYVILVSGFVLAVLALFSPGTGIIEVGAGLALVLAGYGIYNLPLNPWALGLLVLGVFPFLLALRRWRSWWLLMLSIAALVLGSVFLFRTPQGGFAIHPVLAVVVSGAAVGLLWVIGRKGMEAIFSAPAHNLERLTGMQGRALTEISGEGTVYVNGEEWSACSAQPIPAESSVEVVGRRGLVLEVKMVDNKPQG